MPIVLKEADIWTPMLAREFHLRRTITYIYTIGGEVFVEYITGDTGDISDCLGSTFRQWISKMRCTRTVDEGVAAVIREYEDQK